MLGLGNNRHSNERLYPNASNDTKSAHMMVNYSVEYVYNICNIVIDNQLNEVRRKMYVKLFMLRLLGR